MYGMKISLRDNPSSSSIPEGILSETESPGSKKTLQAVGMLAEYSDPERRKPERNAWKNAAVRKHDSFAASLPVRRSAH